MKAFAGLLLGVAAVAYVAALGNAQQPSQPRGMSLWLELFVDDVDKSVEFYTEVLGFERLKGG